MTRRTRALLTVWAGCTLLLALTMGLMLWTAIPNDNDVPPQWSSDLLGGVFGSWLIIAVLSFASAIWDVRNELSHHD